MILSAISCRQFLLEELARRQQTNPRYSQRAFAKQMRLSAGELSEILRGRRALSLKSALKIARALGLNSTETKHLVHLSQIEKSARFGAQEALLQPSLKVDSAQLEMDAFHLISDWYCLAILNLADCVGFEWNTNWIANRLGITRAQAQSALDRLERIGLIKCADGRRRIDKQHVYTTSGVSSDAIRAYHRAMLKKASDALDFQKVEERELSGVGLAIDPRNLESMRQDISDFQEQMLAKYAKGKRLEVYQLQIALFRLSEGESNGS